MEVIEKISKMQKRSDTWRAEGHTIACVPTMGYLHEGHLQLMRTGRKKADRLIMTLFVNPIQFGPQEDYARYPRDTEGDFEKVLSCGVDAIFMPSVEEMYPEGFQTSVRVKEMTRYLCGKSRPDHFEGVATVVAKLFNITKPHLAIFGDKDYQQVMVIKRMVRDLNMDIEVIGIPTVREIDGLAMSSRNTYLSPEERKSALSLKKGLDLAQKMVVAGERNADKIKNAVEGLILAHPFTRIDYIVICDPERLTDIAAIEGPCLMALAVKVGKARLIDNSILEKQ